MSEPRRVEEFEKSNTLSNIIDIKPLRNKRSPKTSEIVIGYDFVHAIKTGTSYFDKDFIEEDNPIMRREALIRTSEFLNRLMRSTKSSSLTLNPYNCRFKAENRDTVLFILEDPPAVRTVQFSLPFSEEIARYKKQGRYDLYAPHIEHILETPSIYKDSNNNYKYDVYTIDLQFPYIVYAIELYNSPQKQFGFKNLKVFFRPAPLDSLHDPLFKPPLTNTDTSVCLGNLSSDKSFMPEDGKYTPQHTINNILMSWWSNIFNTDLQGTYDWYTREGETPYSGILAWHYFTVTDPMFIYSTKMRKSEQSLIHIVNNINSFATDEDNNSSNNGFTFIKKLIYNTYGKEAEKIEELYSTNVAIGSIYISVGDDVLIDGKLHYLTLAGYNAITGRSLYVEFENEAGETVRFPYDDDSAHYIFKNDRGSKEYLITVLKQTTERTVNEILIKGTLIKLNDIVKVNMLGSPYSSESMYSKVYEIRIARDGLLEIKLNSGYFLPEGIELQPVNMDKIVVSEALTLTKGELYFVTDRNQSDRMRSCIYQGGHPDGNRLHIKFIKTDDERSFTIPLNDMHSSVYTIIQPSSNCVYQMIRVGCHIKLDINHQYFMDKRTAFCKLPSNHINPNIDIRNRRISESEIKQNYKFIFDMMVKSESIDIKGFDHDVNFKIGDEVVYANWEDENDLLRIRTITGFESDDDALFIELMDENGETLKVAYIDYETSFIDIIKIRKIYRNINGFERHMKVKPIIGRIPMFPKSGTYQIEYFIETGNTPLIMFNNKCTQWFDSRFTSQFEIIPKTNKRWDKLKLQEFDESKYVYQSGDLVIYPSSDYIPRYAVIVGYDGGYLRIKAIDETLKQDRNSIFRMSKADSKIRFRSAGIPNPRVQLGDFNTNHQQSRRNVSFWNEIYNYDLGILVKMPGEHYIRHTPIYFDESTIGHINETETPIQPSEDMGDEIFDEMITDELDFIEDEDEDEDDEIIDIN